MKNIIIQSFGLCAMFFLFSVYQQVTRKRLIICKLCADLAWVVHYFLLGAYGGVIPNFVGIFRELVFVNKDKNKFLSSPFIPAFFVLLNFGLGIATFKSPINILPICASAVVTISLWCNKPIITKLITIPVCIAFLIYDFFVHSYIGMINESISIISIIIYLVKIIYNSKRRENNE